MYFAWEAQGCTYAYNFHIVARCKIKHHFGNYILAYIVCNYLYCSKFEMHFIDIAVCLLTWKIKVSRMTSALKYIHTYVASISGNHFNAYCSTYRILQLCDLCTLISKGTG